MSQLTSLFPSLSFFREARASALILAATLIAGCGGVDNEVAEKVAVYPVKGSVVLASGQPLNGGKIEFIPAGETARPAVGVIGSDGTFTLETGGIGTGAAEGNYKVKVEPDFGALNLPKTGKVAKAYPFAMKYLEEDTSGLVATIKSGDNQLEPFELKLK